MAIYHPPSAGGFEPRHMVFSTWVDHLPFGYDLVAAIGPQTLVELGVFSGLSYFGFCQAVHEQGLETRCFGVDTWLGDRHTTRDGEERYGEELFHAVTEHNQKLYSDFSTLLRMSFDEAASRFAEESLDLVHLDGLHTYGAVREDFRTWYPKLGPGGLFLFHDIRARLFDFGVWRFWNELEAEHETFAFDHGFGLGVLRKPGGGREGDPDLLRLLFTEDVAERTRLRRYYAYAARHADLERKEHHRQKQARMRSRREDPREDEAEAGRP